MRKKPKQIFKVHVTHIMTNFNDFFYVFSRNFIVLRFPFLTFLTFKC